MDFLVVSVVVVVPHHLSQTVFLNPNTSVLLKSYDLAKKKEKNLFTLALNAMHLLHYDMFTLLTLQLNTFNAILNALLAIICCKLY